MRLKLPALATACDKTGVSDRAAAMISSAVIEDVGLLSKTNPTMTIDRMKIRRARKEQRELLIHKETTPLLAIFFDGRKDKTLLYKKNEEYEHFKRITVLEENITILQEPG
jgi:hypothetical protein